MLASGKNTNNLKYENMICGVDLEEMKRALLEYLSKHCKYTRTVCCVHITFCTLLGTARLVIYFTNFRTESFQLILAKPSMKLLLLVQHERIKDHVEWWPLILVLINLWFFVCL
jgi:hypothetical protein